MADAKAAADAKAEAERCVPVVAHVLFAYAPVPLCLCSWSFHGVPRAFLLLSVLSIVWLAIAVQWVFSSSSVLRSLVDLLWYRLHIQRIHTLARSTFVILFV